MIVCVMIVIDCKGYNPSTVHADLYSLVRHACSHTFCQAEAFENKSPTLAPTSGQLTSTFELMALFSNQAEASSATKLVFPITDSLGSELANKKQKKEA
jgi:hypothetical protein